MPTAIAATIRTMVMPFLVTERLEGGFGAIVAADLGDRLGELRADFAAAHRNRQLYRDLAAYRYALAVALPIRFIAQIGIFDGLAARQQLDIPARRQGQRQLLDLVAGEARRRRGFRQCPRAEQKLARANQHLDPFGRSKCLTVKKFRPRLEIGRTPKTRRGGVADRGGMFVGTAK